MQKKVSSAAWSLELVDFTPLQINYAAIIDATNAQIALRTSNLAASTTRSQTASQSAQANAELAAGTPPWRSEEEPDRRTLARRALAATDFIPASVARDALSADEDTPKLFAAYDAIVRLKALAEGVAEDEVQKSLIGRANKRFSEGLAEIESFLNDADFKTVNLIRGERLFTARSEAEIERRRYDYVTPVLYEGDPDLAVPEWAGVSGFTINLTNTAGTTPINVDLTSLADNERTLQAVVDIANTALETAGAVTRFERARIGPLDDNGVAQGDDWGLKVAGTQTESLSFSAATSSPAVYLVGASGDAEARAGQISKWTNLDAAEPTRQFANRLEADAPPPPPDSEVSPTPPNA
ncbi:MAG: hypothetical protein AAF719_12855, partial [Pseudomonadota bacterium]